VQITLLFAPLSVPYKNVAFLPQATAALGPVLPKVYGADPEPFTGDCVERLCHFANYERTGAAYRTTGLVPVGYHCDTSNATPTEEDQ